MVSGYRRLGRVITAAGSSWLSARRADNREAATDSPEMPYLPGPPPLSGYRGYRSYRGSARAARNLARLRQVGQAILNTSAELREAAAARAPVEKAHLFLLSAPLITSEPALACRRLSHR